MPIYKTLENSWILNILRKEIHFPIPKETIFFRRIGVFTSLGVSTSFQGYFTWPCTDISKKGNNLRKWWLNLFSFHLHKSNVKSEKNVTRKNVSYSVRHSLQSKLNTWRRTNWQVISTLPSLMIILRQSSPQVYSNIFNICTKKKEVPESISGPCSLSLVLWYSGIKREHWSEMK